MNNFQRNIYRTENNEFLLDSLEINSSIPASGTGTLDITGGQPLEIIYLTFTITASDVNFNSLEFDTPVSVPVLDPTHLIRTGTITLDASGDASSIYLWDIITTDSSCLVTITARSSIYDVPIVNTTNINN